jgi:hypothetical protein
MFWYFYNFIQDCSRDCCEKRKFKISYKDLYTEQLNINTELAKRLNEYNSLIKKLKDL